MAEPDVTTTGGDVKNLVNGAREGSTPSSPSHGNYRKALDAQSLTDDAAKSHGEQGASKTVPDDAAWRARNSAKETPPPVYDGADQTVANRTGGAKEIVKTQPDTAREGVLEHAAPRSTGGVKEQAPIPPNQPNRAEREGALPHAAPRSTGKPQGKSKPHGQKLHVPDRGGAACPFS